MTLLELAERADGYTLDTYHANVAKRSAAEASLLRAAAAVIEAAKAVEKSHGYDFAQATRYKVDKLRDALSAYERASSI